MGVRMGWSPRCYNASFVASGLLVPEKKGFKGFYHIWAWRISWLCDADAANKLSFPISYNLALIGIAVSEKKTFEHSGRRTDGRRTMYTISSLTYEPLAQGS